MSMCTTNILLWKCIALITTLLLVLNILNISSNLKAAIPLNSLSGKEWIPNKDFNISSSLKVANPLNALSDKVWLSSKDFNIYNQLNRSNLPIQPMYHANGGIRTGSTMLFDIIRVLIRDKIDPNIYSGFMLPSKKTNYIQLNRSHGECGSWIKGDIYIAHRNVSHQICSAIQSGFIDAKQKRAIGFCAKQWHNYQICKNHRDMVYDMNFDTLIKNRTKVIEDIAYTLNITHVMSEYDYVRIDDELQNLVPPTLKGGHPVDIILGHHVHPNKTCDYEWIVNEVIKADENCNTFYEFVNDLLLNDI